MASAHLYRTLGTPTNEKKWTYSAWIKRSQYTAGHGQFLIACFTDASNRGRVYIEDGATSQLEVADRVGGSFDLQKKTSASLRDESAWYHIVVGHDRTISTPVTNMYINGVLQTSFAGDNTVAQNAATSWNKSGSTMLIGKYGGGAQYFSGLMAHVHFCDGYLYAASDFGETDTTTGIWKPKTSPTVTYGNNGCFLKFDNAANMGLDSSGESNNFTTSGTIIQPKDTPSNIFNTWNPLENYYPNSTLSICNSKLTTATSTYTSTPTILGVSKGKYYWEIKVVSSTDSGTTHMVGVVSTQQTATTQELGNFASDYGYYGSDGKYRNNNSWTTYGTAFANGTIICVALDLDNNKLYFKRDANAWENSGDPTSGSTGTGAISIVDPASTPLGYYFPACTYYDSGDSAVYEANFGNGYFGTTAVSSAQNPDDGIGIFEYDVPAGYRAICTKSLNAQEYS